MIEKLYEVEIKKEPGLKDSEKYHAEVYKRTAEGDRELIEDKDTGSKKTGSREGSGAECRVLALAQEMAEGDHRGQLKIVFVPG